MSNQCTSEMLGKYEIAYTYIVMQKYLSDDCFYIGKSFNIVNYYELLFTHYLLTERVKQCTLVIILNYCKSCIFKAILYISSCKLFLINDTMFVDIFTHCSKNEILRIYQKLKISQYVVMQTVFYSWQMV